MGDKTSTSDIKNKFDQVRIITNPLSSKPLDADGMIENIMSKKQVFVKKPPNSYPPWLTPGSGKVPPLYSEIWKAVECPANPGFCNTPILSQILMSSGVTTQTLGYIWGLVNKKYIGVLTEEELYFTLALIAISQTGAVVRNLDILKEVHEAINPRLDLNIIKHYQAMKRYPQPVTPSISTTQSNNFMHSNSMSFANTSGVSTLSYSEPHTLGQGPLGQNVASGGFQNSNTAQSFNTAGQSEANNNIQIQNISSIVQQQSGARPKTFSWNDEDDDEFTDFQSVATPAAAPPAPNVSITLNPIHYLMASQPSEPNLNNRIQNNNTAISSNLTSSNVNNAAITPSPTKVSKVVVKEEIPTVADDDDFTEFQSSLDFDVEIKQPNILQNIKTMMDVKPQPSRDSQKMTQETLVTDNVASVLVENVPQKTKLEVLDTMSDERNTTMYTTNTRDYSALKNLNAELTDGLFEPDISSTIIKHIIHNPTDVKNSSHSTLGFKDERDITGTKSADDLIFEKDVFQSLNYIKPTNASGTSNDLLVPHSNECDDDDFTDFKAAVPTKQNMDINLFSNSIVDTKNKSSDLEILGNLFNSQLQVNDASQTENLSTYLIQEEKKSDIYKLNCDLSNQNIVKNYFLENNDEDEFDDFVQVPIVPSGQKSYNADLFKTTTENLKQALQPKVEEEDEFTEFEQAPKVFIDTGTSDLHRMKPHIDTTRSDNNSGSTINKAENDWKEYGQDLCEQQTSTESNDKEDRYSALRVLEFLDEDTEEKDLGDGDALSQDRDGDTLSQDRDGDTLSQDRDGDTLSQDRDTSDGDNLSLQLPYVGTHDQDNIQTKCYEACIYTLETSLNLFLSNQIERATLDHPKFIHHLKCLTEVYLVGKRLQKSGLINNNGGSSKLDSTWNALSVYFSDATSFESNSYQNDLQDTRTDNTTGERCEICLCDNSNLSLVEENHVKYHPQCINLYLNCVEPTLPFHAQS